MLTFVVQFRTGSNPARNTIMKKMADDYTIPVKVSMPNGPGRYKHGYVKTLEPNARGTVRIKYANGRISERSVDSIIPEPTGFEVRGEQPIARLES